MPYKDKEQARVAARRFYQLHKGDLLYKERQRRRNQRRKGDPLFMERQRLRCKRRYDAQQVHNRLLKIEVLTHYGNGKCACVQCGYDNDMALSIDHIEGDGATHRRVTHTTAGGYKLYRWLKRHDYLGGFQTLCINCQWIKRQANNEYSWKQPGNPITSNQLSLLKGKG